VKTRQCKSTPWPTVQIEPFLDYLLVECGLAHNTICAYRRDLTHFARYCGEQRLTDPDLLSPISLQKFAKQLSQVSLGSASIARHLAAVRMFLRFHLLTGLIKKDICSALDSPRTWRRLPRVLNQQRTMDLIAGPDPDSPLYLRDRALLELLYATGIRASEAAGLTVKSINFPVGYLNCIGKGNKERIVPVHNQALSAVQQYLKQLRPQLARQDEAASALFLSRTGQPLSRIEMWRIVKKAAQRAGMVGKISPHTLRHCFGSHLLQGGADLRSVQEMLGHADVTTTQIYTQVDQEYLRRVHKQYHPRP